MDTRADHVCGGLKKGALILRVAERRRMERLTVGNTVQADVEGAGRQAYTDRMTGNQFAAVLIGLGCLVADVYLVVAAWRRRKTRHS